MTPVRAPPLLLLLLLLLSLLSPLRCDTLCISIKDPVECIASKDAGGPCLFCTLTVVSLQNYTLCADYKASIPLVSAGWTCSNSTQTKIIDN
jgi:hypothetical protein